MEWTDEAKKEYNRAYYRKHKEHLREMNYYYTHPRDDSHEEKVRALENKRRINGNSRMKYKRDEKFREHAKFRARVNYYKHKKDKEEEK